MQTYGINWILLATLLAALLGFGPDSSPQEHLPFPEIHDWNSLRITLNRSGCYGRCPAYEIEIHGDGTVLYEGKANVATKGKRTGKISHATLSDLVDVFRKADYFSLAEHYVSKLSRL